MWRICGKKLNVVENGMVGHEDTTTEKKFRSEEN
jgi:hypothetical protein